MRLCELLTTVNTTRSSLFDKKGKILIGRNLIISVIIFDCLHLKKDLFVKSLYEKSKYLLSEILLEYTKRENQFCEN